jgi:3',5'-cyclic-nucleotide phosphodiesterase
MNLQALPSMALAVADQLGRGKDIFKIACRLSDDVRAIHISAVAPNNHFFGGQFDELELTKIKNAADGGLDWDSFVRSIENAFMNKKVNVVDSGTALIVSFPSGAGQAQFVLQSAVEAAPSLRMVDILFEMHKLRTEESVRNTVHKEVQKRYEDAKAKETQMEREKKDAQEGALQSAAEEKTAEEEYNRLMKEAQELQSVVTKQREALGDGLNPDVIDFMVPEAPDLSTTVGRIPFPDVRRKYDAHLMRLIKSKYTPLEEDVDDDATGSDLPSHMKVIRPFSKNEYESQMKVLPEDMRKHVMECLVKLDNWDFNVFDIQDFTDRGSLFTTAYALFVRHDCLRRYSLDEGVVLNFLSQIEAGYHPNPYHNSMHAADVLHILHYIMHPGELVKTAKLTNDDVFAALIAGMIHDYDHPGINNNFHVKVQSYLATLYNDRSILENHHCAEVFDLMKKPEYDILASLPEEQRRDIRETIIEMVLSTDMGLHAKILGTWKRRIAQDTDLHAKKEDQRLALSMAIKMADISNCGRPEQLYLRWATKIAEEFFLQGDRERNLGNPVSPFMDRYVPSMAKGQIAFMNYIVIPLFESISEYLPEMHFSVDHCEQNKNYWATNDDTI